MTKRVRTTISIDPEVLEIFKRMGEAANTSTSKVMGEWLADTADAAQMIMLKMEEAKKAPMRVMRELQAMVAGMSDQLDIDKEKVRAVIRGSGSGATRRGEPTALPPSSNTGVLVPREKGTKKRVSVAK